MKHARKLAVLALTALGLLPVLLTSSTRAQTPPAEFYTNLVNGGTTLNMRFLYHPIRSTNFAVFVQDATGAFTNFTPDVARTYLGYATNRSDALGCATLLPNGQIWARVVLGDNNGVTWFFQNGTTTASSTRGSSTFTASWPTTTVIGAGGAGTNIYATDAGFDLRWSYLNSCGGDLNTAVRHAEQTVMACNVIYLQDAGIVHHLQTLVIRGSQAQDPYENNSSLLTTVRSQWTTTLPPLIGRSYPDEWGLASPGYGGGVAYVGTIGGSSGCSVSDVSSLEWDIVWRHENGHNWSDNDYQGGQAEGATIQNGNSVGRFSGPELYKIVGYRNTRLSVLQNLGPYSFRLPPHAALDLATVSSIGSAAIDVLNNDHDGNGVPISIKSFQTTSAFGATITRSVGTGPGGRDRLVYTATPTGGFGLDRFNYQIQDTNGMTMTADVFVQVSPPDNDLVGHWPFDETSGATAHDVSGGLRDGTVQTNNAWVDGVFGGALQFNGTAMNVSLPAFNLNTNTMTITAWIKRNGTQSSMAGLVFSRAGSTISGLSFGTTNELRYTWNGASATYNWSSGLVVPDSQWAFVALVVEPSKGTLYLDDGTGLRSAVNSVANASQDFSSTTYIGQDSLGGRFFNGVMDDVHVFRRALSAGEIAQFAAGGGTAYNPNPAMAATVASESAVLSWQNPRYAQSQQIYIGTNYNAVRYATTASPEFMGSFTGSQFNATLLAAGTYYWRVDEVYNGQPLEGPIWFFTFTPVIPAAQWRLNETTGTTAYDWAGTNNGTFYNSPTLNQAGVLIQPTNRAVTFNGTNQKVDVPASPLFLSTPLTIEVWCKVTGGQGTYRSPTTCRNTPPERGWTFYAATDNTWQLWAGTGGTNNWTILNGPTLVTNQWVQLVGVIDDTAQRFYVNGALVDSADTSYVPPTNCVLRIGAGNTEGSGGAWFPGSVDQVTLYNYALSDDDVAAHYNSQTDDPPVFTFDPFTKSPATPGVAYSDSLANDATDPNVGDTLTFSKVSGPAWLSVAANGTFSGTPGASDAGLNSFSVKVTDMGGLTDTATMLISVGATVWNGAGTNSQWTTAVNWSGTAPTNGQALFFQGLARRVNTNNFLTTAGPIGLNNAGYSIGGGALTLNAGMASYGLNVWNVPSTLSTNQTFYSSIGMLTLGGSLDLNGQTLTTDGTDDVLLSGVVSNTGALVKKGSSTSLILAANNSCTAPISVTAGTLQVGNGGTSGTAGSGNITNSGSVKFNRTDSSAFPNVISGSGSVSQIGTGTTTLTASNTYSGTTTINAGTLAVSGGNNRLPVTTTVVFPASASLNIGAPTQAIAAITINNSVTANVDGTGTLMLTAGPNLVVGNTVAGTASLDLSGVAGFVFNGTSASVNVGGQASSGVNCLGTLTLAPNSTLTAGSLNVQTVQGINSYASGAANTGTLNLGLNTRINASTLNLDTAGSDHGYIQYASAVSSPTLTVRATDGSSRATINLGAHTTVGGPTTITTTFDLVSNVSGSGTLDALVGTLTVGSCSRIDTGNIENASFLMGGGTLDATTLVLGTMANNAGNYGTLNSTFTVSGGTVKVATLTVGTHTDSNGALNSTFNLNSGATLQAQTLQAGSGTATRTFNWNNGAIQNYDAATSLAVSLPLTLLTTADHTFNALTNRAITVSAALSGAAGTGNLVKAGPGTLTLSAANTYSGSTVINAGTLALGSGGSIASSPVIALSAGAIFDVSAVSGYSLAAGKTLSGSGAVKGNLVAASGSLVDPGGANVAGTLVFSNNLTLNAQAFAFDLSASPASGNDRITTIGSLTNNGNSAISLNYLTGNLGAGTYTLFTYASRAGSGNFALDRSYPNATLNVGATSVTLIIGSGGSSDALIWKGDGAANRWDVQATSNWLSAGVPSVFTQGDAVIFDDTGTNTPAVNLATNLLPQIVTVNATQDYTFSTTNESKLTGTMSLTKQGTGKLTLNTANDFTGNTAIAAGKLVLGTASAVPGGAGKGNVSVDGTLDVAGFSPTLNNLAGAGTVDNISAGGALVLTVSSTTNSTFGGVIKNSTGTVALAKTGSATLTLSGASAYSGLTSISAGTLALAGDDNRLPTNTAMNFAGTATLDVGPNSQTLSKLTLTNGVTATVTGTGGTLTVSGTADCKIGGTYSGTAQTLNLAGLDEFTFTAPTNAFWVGGQTNTGAASGTTFLADTNSITASSFAVQNVTGSTATQSVGLLYLGQQNTLNVGSSAMAMTRDNGTMQFRAGLTNPSLTIRAADGVSRSGNWTVGQRGSSYFTTNSGVVDLVSGVTGTSTLDAVIGTLYLANIGFVQGTATTIGTFTMGAGLLDASSLVLAQTAAAQTNGTATGTFSVNGGTVKTATLTLGDRGAGGNMTVNATFNLNGGGTLQAQTVQPGANGGTGTAVRTFNWNDGTIRNFDSNTDLAMASGLTLTIPVSGTHAFDIDAGRAAVVSAAIAGSGSLTKSGAGTATLNAANSYTGSTTINAGTLAVGNGGSLGGGPLLTVASGAILDVSAASGYTVAAGQKLQGTGSVRGNITVAGTLAPGGSIGTLTFSNNLALTGTTVMEVTRGGGAPTNDQAVVLGSVTYGGSLVLTNIGATAFVAGDKFQLFAASAHSGNFTNIVWPSVIAPLFWTNRLALDGTVAVANPVNTTPTNMVCQTQGGTNLVLSWPADHLGWRLEFQTNTLSAGLGTNWAVWPGSDSTNLISVPVSSANPAMFFRLVYP